MKSASKCELKNVRHRSATGRLSCAPLAQGKDTVLEALERAEKRVIAISFLLAKLVSVGALLAALVLLEAGFIKRMWETEFRTEQANAQSAPTLIEPGDLRTPTASHAPTGPTPRPTRTNQ